MLNMAEGAQDQVVVTNSQEKVESSSSKGKLADSKDALSIKVICLGDSAVGKSK